MLKCRMIARNLERVRQRLADACRRCGRDPSSVTLIGVTKGVPAGAIQEALAEGLADLGENRVQEARKKQELLGLRMADCNPPSEIAGRVSPVRWHLIGHLQRNKVKDAVGLFDAVHSVDSARLIEELAHRAAGRPRPVEVFLQVNVAGETTKFGCAPGEALALAQAVRRSQSLRLAGLMTIAPFSDDPGQARPCFRALRQLRDELQSTIRNPKSAMALSMGMSQDFEVAVEEGTDYVRIGTAIFGAQGTGQGTRDRGHDG